MFQIQLRRVEELEEALEGVVSGGLDGAGAREFEEVLTRVLRDGHVKIILEMSQLRYCNSAGLGTLLKYVDICRDRGGCLVLLNVPKKVRILLEMVGLENVVDIFETRSAAIEALKEQPGERQTA